MSNEMDVMNMDERQRRAWLLANRATLFLVGIVWIGMIAWELFHRRVPVFMTAMVPAFALLRFAFYRRYQRVQ
jgi:hypothetical protein